LQHALLLTLHFGDVDEQVGEGGVTVLRRIPRLGADGRFLLVLMLVTAALWAPRLRGPIDLRWDAGVYYMLGTSLAEGDGYRLPNEPQPIRAIQYPPLLATVAAVHQKLLGTSDPVTVGSWLRRFYLVLTFCYAAGVFVLSRRFLPSREAFVVGLITILNPQTLFFSDVFMADLPFAVVTVLFLLVATRKAPTGQLAAGALAVAAFGVRATGLALFAGWAGESLLQRQWRALAIRTALGLAAFGGWHAYTESVKSSPEYRQPDYAYQRAHYQFYNVDYSDNSRYVDPFRPELGVVAPAAALERLAGNVSRLPAAVGESVSIQKSWWKGEIEHVNDWLGGAKLPQWLASVAVILLSLPVLAGLLLLGLQGHLLIPLYAAASVALIAVTPWSNQFTRYMVPLTPIFALGFLNCYVWGASRAASSGGSRWRVAKAALAGSIAVALVQEIVTVGSMFATHHDRSTYVDAGGRQGTYKLFYFDQAWQEHDGSLQWLAAHGAAGAVVATSTPPLVYLRSGLKAVMPPYEPVPATAQHLLDGVPAAYLLVDSLDSPDVARRYLDPVVTAYPERWRLVYGPPAGGTRIYQRVEKNGPLVSGSK
jgi:hypothetical protein